jgi:hypothetical protein
MRRAYAFVGTALYAVGLFLIFIGVVGRFDPLSGIRLLLGVTVFFAGMFNRLCCAHGRAVPALRRAAAGASGVLLALLVWGSGGSWDWENTPAAVLLALAAALSLVPGAVRDGGPAGAGAGPS